MLRPTVQVLRAGLITYQQGLNLQKAIASKFVDNDDKLFKNILILCEHFPVYTIGIRSKDYTDEDEKHLKSLGAEFYRTNRGGLITFHGPGQLMVYPIINLKQFKPSVRWYVCHLEQTVISLCKEYGLSAKTTEDTGVWIGNEKICAMGIHAKRYITTHGIALNCDIDLKWFEHIVPCGLVNKGVTSLSRQTGKSISVDKTIPIFLENFKKTFECHLEDCPENETNQLLSQFAK